MTLVLAVAGIDRVLVLTDSRHSDSWTKIDNKPKAHTIHGGVIAYAGHDGVAGDILAQIKVHPILAAWPVNWRAAAYTLRDIARKAYAKVLVPESPMAVEFVVAGANGPTPSIFCLRHDGGFLVEDYSASYALAGDASVITKYLLDNLHDRWMGPEALENLAVWAMFESERFHGSVGGPKFMMEIHDEGSSAVHTIRNYEAIRGDVEELARKRDRYFLRLIGHKPLKWKGDPPPPHTSPFLA